MLALALFANGAARAAITLDATSTTTTNASTISWAHTVGSGSSRILVVGISTDGQPNITAVSYGGTALTLIGAHDSGANRCKMAMYRLVAPSTGTANVVVTLSAARDVIMGAVSYTGVHQTTPTGTFASTDGSGTSASLNVSSAANELVIDVIADEGGSPSAVPGAGQTELWDLGPASTGGFASTEAGAATVTMSWTWTGNGRWTQGGVSLKPAPSADVAIIKTGLTNALAGTNFTYTITITNQGPNTASNVVVSDTLPAGATFVSANGGGAHSSGVVTWPTITGLTNTAFTNFTVTITAPSSGPLTNTASSTSTTLDPTSSNNDGSSAGSQVVTTITPLANVAVTKTGLTNVHAGTNFTYTITITNKGPSTASSIVVTDTLPATVTFVSANGGGSYASGVVTWPSMTMTSTATTNFTVTVTAPASGTLTNVASSSSTTADTDASNNNGSSASAKVVTTLIPVADVAVTKTGLTNALAGTNFTYTITITNKGPSSASGIVVTDTLPATVTFVSANAGGTHNSGVVTWPSMTMTNTATTNFTVTVTAPASGTLTNRASSSSTTGDPVPSNNDSSLAAAQVITTITRLADVAVTKTGATNVHAGTNITYTITVTNKGPSTAASVVVDDTLPTGATFVSASSGGVESGGVVSWPAMAMANADSTNFTVTITAPGSGPITNVAWSTSSTADTDASNNNGSSSSAKVVTTLIPVADVATTKTGPTVTLSTNNITYTVTVTNQGPSTATSVVVSDTLPAGVVFVSANGGGVHGGGVVTWPAMTMTNAATTNFIVVVTAPASGSLTNTVSSTSATGDPTPSNNNGTADDAKVITTIVPTLADVVTSATGPGSVLSGASILYTIAVTNLGPGTASNLVVFDTLAAGVVFVSASSGGIHSAGVVTWPTMTNFANGAFTNFTLTVTAPEQGTLTNTVASTSSSSDPFPANNDGSASEARVVTLILGVSVSGYAYLDANHNLQKDTGEAGTGLTLFAKIFATTNASGPALQAAAVNGTTGAYTLTNIARGTYIIILDNNSTLSDVTPTILAGWSGTEMPEYTRNPVAVTAVALPNQNFGLIGSLSISGKVFKDNGAGGGTANDGTLNGGETGLGGVTVRLTDDTGSSVYDTATTDGSGSYTLLIPGTVADGAILKVTETNSPMHLSTGASLGNTGGTYDRASDTIVFSYFSGTIYTGANFGDVPANSFTTDNQQAGLPGSFVIHTHTFTAGSVGSLSFTVDSLPNPTISGWSQVLYRDVNCNAQIDSSDTIITAAITTAAGDKICILVKDFIPPGAPFNAQDQLTVTATFTWTGASPALSTNREHTDLTIVGNPPTAGLTLVKTVDKATALPGEVLSYTVTYANKSSASLTNIIIFDQTPAFTTFTSAGYGALPASLTGITVSAPSVGVAGAIKWTLTGNLAPASSSTVTFSVTVGQ